MKLSEQHANGIFATMLSEGEESVCTVSCAVKPQNMHFDRLTIPFGCYASCTTGGRLLLAVFDADIFEEYSVKAFEISLLRNLKIKKKPFGEYHIIAIFPMENRSIVLEISVSPKAYHGGFPNQEENLEKMLEILRNTNNQ